MSVAGICAVGGIFPIMSEPPQLDYEPRDRPRRGGADAVVALALLLLVALMALVAGVLAIVAAWRRRWEEAGAGLVFAIALGGFVCAGAFGGPRKRREFVVQPSDESAPVGDCQTPPAPPDSRPWIPKD